MGMVLLMDKEPVNCMGKYLEPTSNSSLRYLRNSAYAALGLTKA
jgi:hypothetical protein